ncbi:hypothetical protein ACFSR7_35815 [Cohnella sp. GCM10020058]|uniref:hypothetical protein n=1 Tax=Cohnella sp. GCM10020058 TaxID=3317330 RepID=UPI00363BDA71
MDYMKELNSFRNWLLVNPLSTGEIALWHTLISINNMTGWIEWFTAPNTTVQLLTGLSKQGLDNSRNKLIQKGLISYRKGNKNAAGYYKMVPFERMVKKTAQIVDQRLDQELDQGVDHSRDRDLTTLGTESGPGSRPLLDIDIDEDKDETKKDNMPPRSPQGGSTRFKPPTLEEVQAYCRERNNDVNAIKWYNFYAAKGWMIGKNKMKDWKRAVITWERSESDAQHGGRPPRGSGEYDLLSL